MRTTALLFLSFLLGNAMFAQDKDPKAKQILDEVSKKIKLYTSFSLEFSSTLEKKADNINEKQSGKATIKGDKYIVEVAGQKIICDGKTVWTVLTKEKEVYVNSLEDAEEGDNMLNPSKMFTLWEKDFKYKYIKETTLNGNACHEIHLFPTNPVKSKYHTIIVKVDKVKKELASVVVKGKDGEVLTYQLDKLTPNVAVDDADFKFVKSKYPGYTVID